MTSQSRMLKNGIMLAAVAVLMRTVSVAFNAYLKGALGEGGMGLVSLTLSVYGFAVTFATSGISLSVTRLVAEALGLGRGKSIRSVLRAALGYALFFGLLAGSVLFFASDGIARTLLGDLRTRASLRLLAVSLPPIAVSGVLQGYFVAVGRVSHNAVTQLFEQGLRIGLTVSALTAFLPRGLEYACLAVVGGSSIAELCSFCLLLFQFLSDRRRHPTEGGPPARGALGSLCRIALPTAAAAWCRSGLLTAEHLLIPAALAMGAFSREEALSAYAALHGMALPVVLWPTAVLSAFAGLLVPEVASRYAAGKKKAVFSLSIKALTAAAAFSFASAAVLFVTADGLGLGIYRSPAVANAIRTLAPLVPVMYMDSVTDALLKGMGHQVYCMGVNIADAASAVILVLLLLPGFGGEGYLWVIWATEILNFALSFSKLCRLLHPMRAIAAPLLLFALSAAGAAGLTHLALPPSHTATARILRGIFALLAFSLPIAVAAGLRAFKGGISNSSPPSDAWIGRKRRRD